jgi:uncharacterized protein YggE
MPKFSTTFFTCNLAISACFLLLTSAPVFANSSDYGIEVRGQADVVVEPDSFALSVAVVEKGRLTDKVRALVDHKSNQVIEVAKRLKIKPQNINSARVSLRIIKEDPRINIHGVEINQRLPEDQKSKVYVGVPPANNQDNVRVQSFELSRTITVNFSNIKAYDQFLNAVIKIGVSQISPLTMSVGDTDKYYQQALAQAIENAKTKAKQIAQQSEQKLGKLVYVKELSSNHYRSRYSAAMKSVSASYGHNSQVGNQVINASVLVKYSME